MENVIDLTSRCLNVVNLIREKRKGYITAILYFFVVQNWKIKIVTFGKKIKCQEYSP